MQRTQRKGFTLVELVIAIAIIAILSAVLIPTFASLIRKSNMSLDVQNIDQMNTILQADESTSGKPATIVKAKNILDRNGCKIFASTDEKKVYYWIGSENRVILWQKDEPASASGLVVSADHGAETGRVTYPEDLAEKYNGVTTVSVDWSDLSAEYSSENITPAGGQSVEEVLLEAVSAAGTDKGAYFVLPRGATLHFTAAQNRQFSAALKSAAGAGKHIVLDFNSSILHIEDTYGIDIPDDGRLEIANGTFAYTDETSGDSAFQVGAGASLVLRDMKMIVSTHTVIAPLDNSGEVIIDGTEMNSNAHFGISTSDTTSGAVHIMINDSTINNTVNGGGIGVSVNCAANVRIEGSRVVGSSHALLVRAGHVEVKSTTLETTLTAAGILKYDSFKNIYERPKRDGEYMEGVPETYMWGEANVCPGAVLVAGDYAKETESYLGDVHVDLTDVVFKSANKSEIPYCLVAAKLTKNVTLGYNTGTNLDEPILYNYMIPQYFGTITVNGAAKTLS